MDRVRNEKPNRQKVHWEGIYTSKAVTAVSWYQAEARLSLRLLREAGVVSSACILDVGGGASTFVDGVLGAGFEDVTVLDLSKAALVAARARLGASAARVGWIEADVLDAPLAPRACDVWHDRAVFHFLTTEQAQQAYVRKVLHAVKPSGIVIIATFAQDGPSRCSGLPTARYSVDELCARFGHPFELLNQVHEIHRTPGGAEQSFVYCVFRR